MARETAKVTVACRLSQDDLAELDMLAQRAGVTRAALVEQFLLQKIHERGEGMREQETAIERLFHAQAAIQTDLNELRRDLATAVVTLLVKKGPVEAQAARRWAVKNLLPPKLAEEVHSSGG